MKNKKPLWPGLCVLAAVVLLISGCGGKKGEKAPEKPDEKAEQGGENEYTNKIAVKTAKAGKDTEEDTETGTGTDEGKDLVTIRFDCKGGSRVGEFKVKAGAELRMPYATREGYEFSYWADKEDTQFHNAVSYTTDELDPDKDGKVELEAVWIQLLTIKFDTRGGTPINDMYVRQGESAQLPSRTKRDGYEFGGWEDADGSPVSDSSQIKDKGTVTLYASWVRAVFVHFDSNGGNEIPGRTLTQGVDYDDMPVPVREGCRFWGWYYPDGKKLWYEMDDDKVWYSVEWDGSEVTLTAQWRETVLIHFDTDGGTLADDLLWVKGEPADLGRTEKEGYDFAGWQYPDGSMLKDNAIDADRPGSEITLTAVWAPKAEPAG